MLNDLWSAVFPVVVIVFVLVQALVLWLVIRYRRKSDDEAPKQVHGSAFLEIGWTIVPALILLIVGVMSVGTLFKLDASPSAASNPIQVQVIGHQWWWEFSYPHPEDVSYDAKTKTWKSPNCMDITVDCVRSANELVIPADRQVNVEIQSKDVIHSFWVPSLAGKMDATSGMVNRISMQAFKPGEYFGQCAEFCGLSHANMRFRVKALNQADYDKWWTNQQLGAVQASTAAQTRGHDLFATKGCTGCHMINGRSKGDVGPNLTHFASRSRFAGSLFERDDENLRRWLRNPPEEKPGSLMPNLNLSEAEITDLTAYLQSLK